MALLGQASGGFTESSSALRILHIGVRNTVGQLSANAFTQTNPPSITVAATTTQASGLLDGVVRGVLSGSVAFADPTGDNTHAGPRQADNVTENTAVLGIFINNAVGNAFENQPGVASNRGPYVSAQGTYGNKLYETQALQNGGALNAGDDLTYTVGQSLVASLNGYLTNNESTTDNHVLGTTVIGILKIVPDSNSDELVYDQRI
tara:strand:+ start:15903 stop:16517 length:615 start_codon:yes stop_codon:yes gene_type:complete